MKKYYFALDLKDDPALIAEYERHHRTENCWPEITQSIFDAGILDMQIYRTGNRLFMIIDTVDNFDPGAKTINDAQNTKVQEWEQLMSVLQQPLPWANAGEKWVPMHQIYGLNK